MLGKCSTHELYFAPVLSFCFETRVQLTIPADLELTLQLRVKPELVIPLPQHPQEACTMRLVFKIDIEDT